MPKKIRLDVRVTSEGLAQSRERAKALIMAGRVLVDETPVDKPGTPVPPEAAIKIKGEDIPFVSRGGLKLDGALNALKIDVTGLICIDVGASTGGFTDCLLQRGASKVYAVDVGYGQLAWKLRQDSRVISIERTNIRHMPEKRLPEKTDLAVIDASFISLKIVVPAVLKFLKPDGQILALIKPQFEVGKGKVGKGGVVRDESLQLEVIGTLGQFFESLGLEQKKVVPSPILGPKGNREFISHLVPVSIPEPNHGNGE